MATQAQIAEHLGLSQPAIAQLVALGILQRAGRAGMDIDACRLAYIGHLRDIAAGRTGDATLTSERIRLTSAQAAKVEMANAQRRGEILEIGPMVQLFCDQAAMVRTRLLAIPSSAAPDIHRCKTVSETQQALADAIHEALEALCADAEAAEAAITNAAPQPPGDHEDDDADDTETMPAPRNRGRGTSARADGAKPRRAGLTRQD